MGTESEPNVTTYYQPDGLRNGREVGAWAYGVKCGLTHHQTAGSENDAALHVAIEKEHVDGAATAIVAAGGGVRRVSPGEFSYPLADGHVAIVVTLGA